MAENALCIWDTGFMMNFYLTKVVVESTLTDFFVLWFVELSQNMHIWVVGVMFVRLKTNVLDMEVKLHIQQVS